MGVKQVTAVLVSLILCLLGGTLMALVLDLLCPVPFRALVTAALIFTALTWSSLLAYRPWKQTGQGN
ncbi:hypothetical protein GXW82_33185 [Streptacidiphilus sp. 4-A2]|nr:hypothetical protein [Streptacidiphilus sp. 4-A2]